MAVYHLNGYCCCRWYGFLFHFCLNIFIVIIYVYSCNMKLVVFDGVYSLGLSFLRCSVERFSREEFLKCESIFSITIWPQPGRGWIRSSIVCYCLVINDLSTARKWRLSYSNFSPADRDGNETAEPSRQGRFYFVHKSCVQFVHNLCMGCTNPKLILEKYRKCVLQKVMFEINTNEEINWHFYEL